MLTTLKTSNRLVTLINDCNQLVIDTLKGSNFKEAQIALESFKSGGKRLRPALMMLTSTIPQQVPLEQLDDTLVDLAGAIELIHLATLFHDDVIDDVDTRRSSESAKVKYGNHASVLAGDFALAEGLSLVQRSKLLHTMSEFLRTIRVLVRGESRETQHKFDFNISDAVYYEIISEKSASLFALSCKVGALSQHSEFSDTLGHFGWNLGMAFQMIDDLDDMLDIMNDSSDCDLRNGYFALPIIQAFNNLEDGNREKLVTIIRDADFTRENEQFIASLYHRMGAINQTRTEIHEHLNHAGEILNRFETSEAVQLLGLVIDDLKGYADKQVENYLTVTRPVN